MSTMDSPYLHRNGELVAIYRLEFYKKKMNWKFSQDYKPQSADTEDIELKDDEESHPKGNTLNKTYTLVEDSGGECSGDFNHAFMQSDQDNNSKSALPSSISTSKSKNSSHKQIASKTNNPHYIVKYKYKNFNSTSSHKCPDHIKYPNKPFPSHRDAKLVKDTKKLSMSRQTLTRDNKKNSGPNPKCSRKDQSNKDQITNVAYKEKSEKWSEKIYSSQQAESCPELENAESQNLLEKVLEIPSEVHHAPVGTQLQHSLTEDQNFPKWCVHEQNNGPEENSELHIPSNQYIETESYQNYSCDVVGNDKLQNYYESHQEEESTQEKSSQRVSARLDMLQNLSKPKQFENVDDETIIKNEFEWPNSAYDCYVISEHAGCVGAGLEAPGFARYGARQMQYQAEETISNIAYLPHNMFPLPSVQPTFAQHTNLSSQFNLLDDWFHARYSGEPPPGFGGNSLGSEEEFMREANLVPHSSELEINMDEADEPLAPERLSTAQLAAEVQRHSAALHSLLGEAAARQRSRSSYSFSEYASEHPPLAETRPSYEELPTRDIGLCSPNECVENHRNWNSFCVTSAEFIAGSFRNNAGVAADASWAGFGRGRGRGCGRELNYV